jgi:hypothetical protein
VALRAVADDSPKEMDTWNYLDRIESAIDIASAVDAVALHAVVIRAYLARAIRRTAPEPVRCITIRDVAPGQHADSFLSVHQPHHNGRHHGHR